MTNPGGRNPRPVSLPETILINLQQRVGLLERVRVDSLFPARADLIFATSPIFANQEIDLDLQVFKSARLLRILPSAPCRIKAYGTDAARQDDKPRVLSPPPEESGCQLEKTFLVGHLEFNPINRSLVNLDIPAIDTIYFTIKNTTAITQEYNLVFTLRREE